MRKFTGSREQSGFTMIELLVVILIVAILAALAIPIFLRQREKGWISQTRSVLRNSATAAESYSTTTQGDYSGLDGASSSSNNAAYQLLVAEGFKKPAYFEITVSATGNGYCVIGTHSELPTGHVWKTATVQSDASDSPTPTQNDTCS